MAVTIRNRPTPAEPPVQEEAPTPARVDPPAREGSDASPITARQHRGRGVITFHGITEAAYWRLMGWNSTWQAQRRNRDGVWETVALPGGGIAETPIKDGVDRAADMAVSLIERERVTGDTGLPPFSAPLSDPNATEGDD